MHLIGLPLKIPYIQLAHHCRAGITTLFADLPQMKSELAAGVFTGCKGQGTGSKPVITFLTLQQKHRGEVSYQIPRFTVMRAAAIKAATSAFHSDTFRSVAVLTLAALTPRLQAATAFQQSRPRLPAGPISRAASEPAAYWHSSFHHHQPITAQQPPA